MFHFYVALEQSFSDIHNVWKDNSTFRVQSN